jgi:hypothetical protein
MCTIVVHYKVDIYTQMLCGKPQGFDTTLHMCVMHWLSYEVGDKHKNTYNLVQQDPGSQKHGQLWS